MKRTLWLSIGLTLLTAVGCGGADEGQIRDAAKSYYAAFAEGDAKQACAFLTTQAKKDLEEVGGCEGMVSGFGGLIKGGDVADQLESAELTDIRIEGSRATAVVNFEGLEERDKLSFEKVGSQWKISETGNLGRVAQTPLARFLTLLSYSPRLR